MVRGISSVLHHASSALCPALRGSTLHQQRLWVFALVLLGFHATPRGATLFFEDFNSYTDGIQDTLQVDTGLLLYYSGELPGWKKKGPNALHAVDLTGSGNTALMLWEDNEIALLEGVAANALNTTYRVQFLGGPAVYADISQATAATDGFVVEILRSDSTVLWRHRYQPKPWAKEESLTSEEFEYLGDGTGPVRFRVRPVIAFTGHFGGAIDDLAVLESGAGTPPSLVVQPDGGTVREGEDFTLRSEFTLAQSFVWKKNGVIIPGATNAIYSIEDVRTSHAGVYTVTARNALGTATSSEARLKVTPAPVYRNYREAILADAPIHYYPLDETSGTTAADLGTKAAGGGSFTGGFVLGQAAAAPGLGTAVHFDGEPGTYIDLGLFHPGDSFTAEAWINLDEEASKDLSFFYIVGRVAAWGAEGSWVLALGWRDLLNFQVLNEDGSTAQPSDGRPILRGLWHHLVGVFDAAAGTVEGYVDGRRVAPATLSGVLQDKGPSPDRVLIGASGDGSNDSFNWKGRIDEVAIYGTALKANQIRDHYHAAAGPPSLTVENAIMVSWPGIPASYILQVSQDIDGPYSDYSGPVYRQADGLMAPIPVAAQNRFFRVIKP